jgi:hypothetical protein
MLNVQNPEVGKKGPSLGERLMRRGPFRETHTHS